MEGSIETTGARAQGRARGRVSIALVAALVGVAATALLPGFLLPSLAFDLTIVAATCAMVEGLRRNGVWARWPWPCVIAAVVLFGVGNVLSQLLQHERFSRTTTADVFLVAGFVAFLAGAAALASRRGGRRDRAALIDAWVLAVAFAFVGWELVSRHLLEGSLAPIDRVSNAVYPLLGAVAFGVVARLAFQPGRALRAYRYLLAATFGLFVVPAGIEAVIMSGGVGNWRLIRATVLVPFLLAAATGREPSIGELTDPIDEDLGLNRARIGLVGGALLTVPAVVIVEAIASRPVDSWGLGVASALLIGLVLVRMFGLVDADERLRAELRYRTLHDPLTGLPNRDLLIDRFDVARARHRAGDAALGLIFVDLDHFKRINDSRGHSTGDHVLRAVAARFGTLVRPGDTVARVGGDEFVVLCENVRDRSEVVEIAERLLAGLGTPVATDDGVVAVSASVGVAFPVGLQDAFSEVVDLADRAMYRAKTTGRGRIESLGGAAPPLAADALPS